MSQEVSPGGTAVAAKKKATANGEETLTQQAAAETSRKLDAKPKRANRGKKLLLAGIGGGMALLLGIILVLTLRHGTLVVEIDEKLGKDVQVAVSQGGEKVQLVDAKSGWTLSLTAGKYDVAVQGGDDQFQLDSESVTVTHGGQVKVKVTLKPVSPAVAPLPVVGSLVGPDGKWNLPRGLHLPPSPLSTPRKPKNFRRHGPSTSACRSSMTNSIGMKLVLIPPGEFMMGSPKDLIEEELKTPGIDSLVQGQVCRRGTTAPGADHQAVLLGDLRGDAGRIPACHGRQPQQVLGHGQGKDKVSRSGHEAVSGGECIVGRCGGVLPEAIGFAGGEGGRATVSSAIGGAVGVCVPRREHGSVQFQFGPQWNSSRSTRSTSSPTTGGSAVIPAG